MNDLEFSFEQSPWEAFLMTKGMGDTVSAVTLLSLLEGEDEQQLEDALLDLETGCMNLDITGLPKVGGSGEAAVRLRREMQLAKKGIQAADLEETDPLRLYLEELAAKIAEQYRKQGGLFFGAMPLAVTIDVQRALPKSLWDKVRALLDTGKPDCDNIAKAVLDALNGVAFDDDAQVVTLLVRKFPRVRMSSCDEYVRVTISDVDTETLYPREYIQE